ncbi:hypothetical protein Pla108_20260 [Botrimarina colliarenosi]|uniref:Type II secretion system protein H n=1 Tax=Botrimarina colliarenosi TaxID=2528001 RepID=A0A5C6ACU7_9BACT|nr:type II secretion system protein [Botrimarina colliarenosi]TWT97872.1 hypothetical protein Pla108_20260 [Botrimarina colliarenosi]
MDSTTRNARLPFGRRAFSLLELVAVIAIVGVIGAMAVTRWGEATVRTASAQGFVRSVALSLQLARRQAIAEGLPAAVLFHRTAGEVDSLSLVRADAGGDVPTDANLVAPTGVTTTTAYDRWEYDYRGALTTPASGGVIALSDGKWDWTLTVNPVTGRVAIAKTP